MPSVAGLAVGSGLNDSIEAAASIEPFAAHSWSMPVWRAPVGAAKFPQVTGQPELLPNSDEFKVPFSPMSPLRGFLTFRDVPVAYATG